MEPRDPKLAGARLQEERNLAGQRNIPMFLLFLAERLGKINKNKKVIFKKIPSEIKDFKYLPYPRIKIDNFFEFAIIKPSSLGAFCYDKIN